LSRPRHRRVAIPDLDLLDWKRRTSELYREVRAAGGNLAAWRRWREVRDRLFAAHPQSPIPPRARLSFGGLPYFPYDPAARVLAVVRRRTPRRVDLSDADGRAIATTCFATASFTLHGRSLTLALYWVSGYGGGLLVPFRDATSGRESYGAGRYVLDTVKGADLGVHRGRLVLDFNFAYNPSCAYDARWSCPLPPPANWLAVPVRAGECAPRAATPVDSHARRARRTAPARGRIPG